MIRFRGKVNYGRKVVSVVDDITTYRQSHSFLFSDQSDRTSSSSGVDQVEIVFPNLGLIEVCVPDEYPTDVATILSRFFDMPKAGMMMDRVKEF